MIDGGWSKYDHEQAIAQLEVLIKVITTLDSQYAAGNLWWQDKIEEIHNKLLIRDLVKLEIEI
jgi:hypothetical protein